MCSDLRREETRKRTIIPNQFKPAYHNGPLLILAKVKHNRRRAVQFLGRMPSDGSRWRPTEDLGSRG
jgi:hypothetical protein